MKVRAISQGFYKGARVPEGQVFEFDGKKPAKWMEPFDFDKPDAKPAKQAKGGKAPQTFSDIAKQDGEAMKVKGADDLV